MKRITKTCIHHGKLAKEHIYIGKVGNRTITNCVLCRRISFKKYYKTHKEKVYADNLAWTRKNKAKMKVANKFKRDRNLANNPNFYKERHANQRDNLADEYIKKLITQDTKISARDVPRDLIELKKVIVLVKRKLKERKDNVNR